MVDFVHHPDFFLAAVLFCTGLMNLIHYWNSTATISLGEVCHWRQIVKIYAEKKLCVKFRTLSVQII